jgi:hypothetical protein
MCLVCVEIKKGELLPSSFANKIEMVLKEDPDHEEELIKALSEADERYLDQLDKFLSQELIKNFIPFIYK